MFVCFWSTQTTYYQSSLNNIRGGKNEIQIYLPIPNGAFYQLNFSKLIRGKRKAKKNETKLAPYLLVVSQPTYLYTTKKRLFFFNLFNKLLLFG